MKKFITLLGALSVLVCSAPGHAVQAEVARAVELARVAAARVRAAPTQQLVKGVFNLIGDLSAEDILIRLGEIEASVEENGYQPRWLTRRQGLYLIGFDGERRHREEMFVRVDKPEAILQMIPEGKRAVPTAYGNAAKSQAEIEAALARAAEGKRAVPSAHGHAGKDALARAAARAKAAFAAELARALEEVAAEEKAAITRAAEEAGVLLLASFAAQYPATPAAQVEIDTAAERAAIEREVAVRKAEAATRAAEEAGVLLLASFAAQYTAAPAAVKAAAEKAAKAAADTKAAAEAPAPLEEEGPDPAE